MTQITRDSTQTQTQIQPPDVNTGTLSALALSVLSGRPIEYHTVNEFFTSAMNSYRNPAILVAEVNTILDAWQAAGVTGDSVARLKLGKSTVDADDRQTTAVLVMVDGRTVQSFSVTWKAAV